MSGADGVDQVYGEAGTDQLDGGSRRTSSTRRWRRWPRGRHSGPDGSWRPAPGSPAMRRRLDLPERRQAPGLRRRGLRLIIARERRRPTTALFCGTAPPQGFEVEIVVEYRSARSRPASTRSSACDIRGHQANARRRYGLDPASPNRVAHARTLGRRRISPPTLGSNMDIADLIADLDQRLPRPTPRSARATPGTAAVVSRCTRSMCPPTSSRAPRSTTTATRPRPADRARRRLPRDHRRRRRRASRACAQARRRARRGPADRLRGRLRRPPRRRGGRRRTVTPLLRSARRSSTGRRARSTASGSRASRRHPGARHPHPGAHLEALGRPDGSSSRCRR